MADVDEMLAALMRLGAMPEAAAARAAPLVLAAARESAAAGTTPLVQAWAPTKKGGRALRNAAAHLTGEASGATIRITLTGVEVIHNYGTSRIPARQIIPATGDIPEAYADAIRKAAEKAFEEALGG